MRSRFYLYASGSESDIRALHDSLKLEGSEIKVLSSASASDQSAQHRRWMWCSPYQECRSDFPEDELTAFLDSNRGLLQQLKACRAALHELVAIIVCQLTDGERPRGYSILSSLMRLLTDANASLEIDIETIGVGMSEPVVAPPRE